LRKSSLFWDCMGLLWITPEEAGVEEETGLDALDFKGLEETGIALLSGSKVLVGEFLEEE